MQMMAVAPRTGKFITLHTLLEGTVERHIGDMRSAVDNLYHF